MDTRKLVTTESEDGRLAFLIIYGIAGVVATLLFLPRWLAWFVLPAGAIAGALMAWRMYGPVELWLDGDTLVRQVAGRTTSVSLSDCVAVSYQSGFKASATLEVGDRHGRWVRIANLGPETEAIRNEVGLRLRRLAPSALNRVDPSTLRALGLR